MTKRYIVELTEDERESPKRLRTTFEAYTKLKFIGQAILLDDSIREVLPAHREHRSWKEHEERLRKASRHVDFRLGGRLMVPPAPRSRAA